MCLSKLIPSVTFRFRTLELSASFPGFGDRPVLLRVKDTFEYLSCHFSRLRKPRMVLKPDLPPSGQHSSWH